MGELIFIGLGLYDEKDISLKGRELARGADQVYSEFYTSSLAGAEAEDIEDELGIEIIELTREQVESEALPVRRAKEEKVVFLTAGDPMAATTHIDLRLRAEEEGIPTRVIHSSSIFSAAPSILGVQHYKFGRTITLPFSGERQYPESPYEGIRSNKEAGLHSLVLLDISGEKSRYMTVNEGIEILMELEERLAEGVIDDGTVMAGLARVGADDVEVKAGFPEDLLEYDFGRGLQCLVVFSELHFMEIDSLLMFADAPGSIKSDR